MTSVDRFTQLSLTHRVNFATATPLYAAAKASGSKKVVGKPGTARATKTLRLSKRSPNAPTSRPPAAGERKAIRKRIVLSNTNALEVRGLADLTEDKLIRHGTASAALESFRGHVLGFSNETVDALRALEAFKPRQGWSLFKRPASLIRKETVSLANDLASIETDKQFKSKIIFGGKGTGKSVLLLQAQGIALVKGWIVMHFPEGQELINAQTAYQPINTEDGTIYIQPDYTAKLLLSLASANQAVLSRLQPSKQLQLPIPIQPNISLQRLAEMGGRDPTIAWPVWQALWSELTASTSGERELQRPPILISMDGVDQVMRMSAYLDADARPIHAHDMALVKHFTDHLSGNAQLPNGGMVIASTCASNRASSPTLEHCLDVSHARQRSSEENDDSTPSPSAALPVFDPYMARDDRVDAVMKDVQALKLEGLSKQEARGVMEYYARSGILRDAVTDGFVSEKWTMAGSGIIGELEKGSIRARY